MSSTSAPSATALRVARLNQNSITRFDLRPDAPALKQLAQELDLTGLRKLSFTGQIAAQGGRDWMLTGTLGATVVQPCCATLVPVTTRIDEPVQRNYIATVEDITDPEVEMPEDDSTEPLGQWIDPYQVMTEALVLALPLYPRHKDADPGDQVFSEPGVVPMRDEDARPFAGLADLKARLGNPSKE